MSAAKKEVSYTIAVSLGKGCYRHIRISSKAMMTELHETILDAFDFVDDHAHAFFMDNRAWSDEDSYFSEMIEDEERFTNEYKLEKLGFYPEMKFKYVFDFGEDWIFQCKVLKVTAEITEKPVVVRTKGEAPDQYGYEDDGDDGDEDE